MPKDNTPSYRWSLIIAIALHVVLVVALFVKFALPSVDQPGWQSQAKIVQASIVGPAATAVQRPQPVKQPPPKPKPVTPPSIPVPKPEPKPESKTEPEIQPKLMPKSAKEQTNTKSEQEKATKLAEQQAAKEHALKLKQEQAAAAKRKAEQQKKLAAKKLQAAQQQLLQQQLAQEQQQLAAASAAAAHNQQIQNEVDKYRALIIQAISQNWLVPDSVNPDDTCIILVKVGPGGTVIDAKVVRSSGNSALDNSAVSAVFKTSPLPVPTDAELFDKFRELRLTVRPENIVGG